MWVYAFVGTLAGVAVLVIIITSICCCTSSRKTKTSADILPTETFEAYENPIWKKTEVEHRESLESLANIAQSLKVYNFIELVYEYASNGPLSDWIFEGDVNQKFLSWTQRVQIVVDVARGLNYIHSYNSPPYVYKDVRSSNVLLDSDFRGKISNFRPGQQGEVLHIRACHFS